MTRPAHLLALLYFLFSAGCVTTQTRINTMRDTVTRVRLNVEPSNLRVLAGGHRLIAETVEQLLQGIGVQVVGEDDPYDATLTVWMRLTARGANYRGLHGGGYFYTGAVASGRMRLATQDGHIFTVSSVRSLAPSPSTTSTSRRPHQAPFDRVWPHVVLDHLYRLWGAEIYIAAFDHSRNAVRHAAIEALTELEASAVEPLIAALNDDLSRVRSIAAHTLGEIGDAHAVEPLIAALNDDSYQVRSQAAHALARIGDARAVDPLIAALNDVSSHVRSAAARALARIGDARAVDPLTAVLEDADSEHERSGAARALGGIADARAVEPLITALKDRNRRVRSQAAAALGNIGDAHAVEPLISVLEDESSGARRAAERALGEIAKQDFGQDQARWQRWWEENRDEILPNR